MTTPKELRQQVTEALLDYYGTNNVHPDDQSDMDDLYDVVVGVIEARDKTRAEEFRRLAAEAKKRQSSYYAMGGFTPAVGESERSRAFTEAAQMLEERLNG